MSLSSMLFAHGSVPAGAPGAGESAFGSPPVGTVHTVAVIGVGYVGLPTAATLAQFEADVATWSQHRDARRDRYAILEGNDQFLDQL